jgi:hypothetical protein
MAHLQFCDDLKSSFVEARLTLGREAGRLGGAPYGAEQQQEERLRQHLTNVKKMRLIELMYEGILSEQSHNEVSRLLDTISRSVF